MLPVNYRSWQRSFSELPILSTVGVDIPVDYSFKSYKCCQQWELTFLLTIAFRTTKIPTTLRADVSVSIRATKNLEDTMLPINYRSWQRSFLELPILSTVEVDIPVDCSFKSYKSCQQWELTFLSTVAFRATKILTTLRADVPVAFRTTKNLKDTVLPVNYRSWQHSLLELSNSCQHWELTFLSTAAFRATKILSTDGIHRIDCSFHSYQKSGRY